MNNMKLYIVGMVLAVMSLTACTAGFLDVESKKRIYYRQLLQDGE